MNKEYRNITQFITNRAMNTEAIDTNKYVALPISGKNGIGKFAIIDKEDAHLFEGRSINMRSSTHLRPCIWFGKKSVFIYNYIMGAAPADGLTIDHINHNVLDNTRANLRWATESQQKMNRRKRRVSSSRFKGVFFVKQSNKWRASISINKKTKHIGLFTSEKDAARAYNQKALELNEEFYHINEISDDEDECDDDIDDAIEDDEE